MYITRKALVYREGFLSEIPCHKHVLKIAEDEALQLQVEKKKPYRKRS